MDKGTACTKRAAHGGLWRVIERRGAWTHYPNGRWVDKPVWRNSTYSQVCCPECSTMWRTNASYVDELPDGERSMRSIDPRDARIAEYVDEYPWIAELTYLGNGGPVDGNDFLRDVANKFLRFGKLTLPQIAAAEGALQRLHRRQAAEDTKAAGRAALEASLGSALAPRMHGMAVCGLITEVWTEDPDTQDVLIARTRMKVLDDAGFTVECTVPKSLLDVHGDQINGRRVFIPKITLKPKWNEPTQAWGSYPSPKSELIT